MLTRREIIHALEDLGFTAPNDNSALAYGAIQVVVLDAPRIAATCPKGRWYMAVLSKLQLQQQLTSMLGYRSPLVVSR